MNIIRTKLIYKIRRNIDGSVNRYKARLVTQGFKQSEGIDYNLIHNPVIKMPNIRIVLSLAISRGYNLGWDG